jgi:hypothetical protein
MEFFVLQRLAGDPPDFIRDVSGEPPEYWVARKQLYKDGRIMHRKITSSDGTVGGFADISPMGRQALRLHLISKSIVIK